MFYRALTARRSLLTVLLLLILGLLIVFLFTNQQYFYYFPIGNKIIRGNENGGGDDKDSSSNNNNNAFATLENASLPSSSSSIDDSKNVSSSPSSLSTTAAGPDRLEYTARYICGTIVGEDGPLRPGRYNSDINIFNRQSFIISFLWNSVPSVTLQEGQEVNTTSTTSNFRLQTIHPGGSVSISCKDIIPSISLYPNITNNNENFFEGVLTISVELDPSIQGAISSSSSSGTIISSPLGTEPNTNILSVDAIYTVNALEVASREIVLQLIEYSINKQDVNGKIPKEIISKVLSITVPIRTNETINPDKQVRDILIKEHALNAAESLSLDITIRNLSLGVGALDDNHAISLQRINAYQPSPASPLDR